MKMLVDGDIFAFRSAAASEKEDEGIAKYYVDQLLDQCIEACNATSYQIYLTGTTNFRYQIYPEYKANRLEQPRPRHLPFLRDYLIGNGAIVSDNCEADDLLGVAQCAGDGNTVIVSLDKDLLMIPGNHYSWEIRGKSGGTVWTKPAVHRKVTDEEGLRWFWTQVLTGDVADNIKGAAGVGKVGAARILDGCTTEAEYLDACLPHFSCEEELEMTAACLWIMRKPNDVWRLENYTSKREAEGP